MTNPFDIDCPSCGAIQSAPCQKTQLAHMYSIWPVRIHISRWRAAGVEYPSLEQLHWEGKETRRLYREGDL